jgi:predicted dinucleotide-binding enzyme
VVNVGVLGTGMVGQAIANKLIDRGHEVVMGAREAGNQKAVGWASAAGVRGGEGTFTDAAQFGTVIVNATAGNASLQALEMAGAAALDGKVLIDVANPLVFGGDGPPTLSVCNDDSLGEQIQRAFPQARVVKALNTMNAGVMVAPGDLGDRHNVFVCGNDPDAKSQVVELLESFGWLRDDIVDLGDISAARGTEMYLPLWLRMMGASGTAQFNIRIISGS